MTLYLLEPQTRADGVVRERQSLGERIQADADCNLVRRKVQFAHDVLEPDARQQPVASRDDGVTESPQELYLLRNPLTALHYYMVICKLHRFGQIVAIVYYYIHRLMFLVEQKDSAVKGFPQRVLCF